MISLGGYRPPLPAWNEVFVEELLIPGERERIFLAERKVRWPLLGASLAATTIGGTSTVVLAEYVAAHGLSGLWLDIPLGFSLILSGLFLAGRIRATRSSSIAGIARLRYGSGFGASIAVLVLLAEFAWFALLALSGASMVMGVTGWNRVTAITGTAAAFSCHTVLGGQRAVIRTDLFQLLLVMVFGLAVPAGFVVAGGSAPEPSTLSFPTGPGMGAGRVLGLLLMMALPGLVGGDVYSRLLSAESPGDAARASVLAGLMKLAAAALVAIIALGGGGGLNETLSRTLPPVLYHAAVFSILMAIMSSADSVLLTGATVLQCDILPRFNASPKLVTAMVALTGTILALAAGSVVEVVEWSYTVYSAGAPLPMLAALLMKKPPPSRAAVMSVLIGGGSALALKLTGNPHAFLIGLGFSLVTLGAGVTADRLIRRA